MMYHKFKSTSPCQHDVGCISKNYCMHNHRHSKSHCQQPVLPKQSPTLIILLQQPMFVSQLIINNLTIATSTLWKNCTKYPQDKHLVILPHKNVLKSHLNAEHTVAQFVYTSRIYLEGHLYINWPSVLTFETEEQDESEVVNPFVITLTTQQLMDEYILNNLKVLLHLLFPVQLQRIMKQSYSRWLFSTSSPNVISICLWKNIFNYFIILIQMDQCILEIVQ